MYCSRLVSCLVLSVVVVLTATARADNPAKVVVKKDVVYGSVHGAGLLADVAYPEGKGPFPVILSVHGGRWVASHRNDPGEGAINVEQWAGFGFFAMTIDYRLAGCTPPPACYQDLQCAIRWVHAHADKYPIDKDRIFLIGMSAGGHLVSLAATLGPDQFPKTGGWEKHSSDFRGVISLSAPYELEKLSWGNLWKPGSGDQLEARKLASPIRHVSAKTRPMLILHSDDDGSVPVQQAKDMAEALEKARAQHRLSIYQKKGHMRVTEDVIKETRAFIEELSKTKVEPPKEKGTYFPSPELDGGWRKLEKAEDIRRLGGMDPDRLTELKEWLLKSDKRDFAAVVIRNGYIVLEVERNNSAKTDSRRVASVSKAVCATVLAIASEQSQQGKMPKKMKFDDPAFDFIPSAKPLSDPRKATITVKQLLNHTSGICPEATGARNDGTWEYILGHSGDPNTAKLAFDPGKGCGYSTHAFHHAARVCETVTGKPYDEFAVEALFKPIGCEKWWFQYYEGGEKYGKHASHGMGMPARDLARIAYCMAHGGRWGEKQVIPEWFVKETSSATHHVKGKEMRFKHNAQSFSHGWELPALRGDKGKGIPNDARFKPGSGGQLITFVPSLDLVITRQTGSSGEWEYEEYLRRACQAVLSEKEGFR